MKKFCFNENISELEIDPDFLMEGLSYAEKKKHNSIRIIDLNHRSGTSFDLDLTPLSNCRFIQSLSIADNFKISSIKVDAIYTLENLINLSFRDKKIKLDFSNLSQIKMLYTKYDNLSTGFSTLKNLEHLLIESVNSDDCSFLGGLSAIKILRISGGTINSLSGIENLSKLVELRIDHCPKLVSVISITELPGLENLHLEKCKLLNNYPFLSGNCTIKSLFISELNSISFIANMKSLEFLHFWSLKDGDLSPILKSETLKTVSFYPNKKNYSHTLSEISSRLSQIRG